MRVEIAITGTVDQENSDHESYYVWFDEEKTMSGRVPRSSCTEIPEPIKRGTMVWAWNDGHDPTEHGPSFYAGAHGDRHRTSGDRCRALSGEGFACDHVRPVTVDDLGGEG